MGIAEGKGRIKSIEITGESIEQQGIAIIEGRSEVITNERGRYYSDSIIAIR